MFVKDFMSKDVISINSNDSITKFISIMEKYNIREAPVIENGRYVGIINYKELFSKGVASDPTKTKIKKFIIKTPTFSKNMKIEDASEFLFKVGFRALPVVEKNKVIGIFSVFDLLKAINNEQIRRTLAEEIMSTAEVIKESDDIGKARFIMREKNISKLPVVNDYGELVGIVSVLDLLKAIKPRERIPWYSIAAEKLTTTNIPVSTIMNKNVLSGEKTESIKSIIDKMIEAKNPGVVITEENSPIGIITTRDILELYLSLHKKEEGLYVQITGLDKSDPDIDKQISEFVRKVSQFHEIQYMYIHIKKYRKTGRIKYSIRCRLMTDEGMFVSKSTSWILSVAVGNALNNIERFLLRKKERKRDKIRRLLRIGK